MAGATRAVSALRQELTVRVSSLHVRRVVVHPRRRYDAPLVRDAPRPAHRDAVRFAQPVRFHALLGGHGVVAVEHAVPVQQRGRRKHCYVAT